MDNYTLNGFGKFNGGEYYDVTINGVGTLNGELNVENLYINGLFTSNALIKSKNDVKIQGRAKFKEDLKCNKLVIKGSAKFNKNLLAEDIIVEGTINVEEEINVGNIEITSSGFSIRELHADKVIIHDIHKIRMFNKLYEIGEIECTYLEANALYCKKVSANNVKLGKNAEIELVEYSDSIDIDPRAKIKEIRKI